MTASARGPNAIEPTTTNSSSSRRQDRARRIVDQECIKPAAGCNAGAKPALTAQGLKNGCLILSPTLRPISPPRRH